MCKREMTLGEEIIGLSARGIDIPTVERMYRKYIEITAEKESKETMKEYCINDELAIKKFINALFGVPAKSDIKDAEVGDNLNEWLHTEFVKALPYSIRSRLTDVTIPTVGEMFGWDDEQNRNHFEADNDKQLPLMMRIYNRVAYYNNEYECGWLRNATKKEFSSARFAFVSGNGNTGYYYASYSFGVRPEIWLVK